MAWNKERIVFGLSLLVFAWVCWTSIGTLGGGPSPAELTVEEPISGGSVPPAQVELPWFRTDEGFASARDPFRSQSSWRDAVADALPEPPLDRLKRRVPLPAPVARASRARPAQESIAPELKTEDQ